MSDKSALTTEPATDIGPVDPNPDLQERIRCRAYELYRQREGSFGDDVNDWLKAEAELLGKAPAASVEQEVERAVELKKSAA